MEGVEFLLSEEVLDSPASMYFIICSLPPEIKVRDVVTALKACVPVPISSWHQLKYKVPKEELVRGDIVVIESSIGWVSYAVVSDVDPGNLKVICFANKNGEPVSDITAIKCNGVRLRKVPMRSFVSCDTVTIIQQENQEESYRRCMVQQGEAFNLLSFNSEHFARQSYEEKKESVQITNLGKHIQKHLVSGACTAACTKEGCKCVSKVIAMAKEVTQHSTSAVVKEGVKRGVKEGSKQIVKQSEKQVSKQVTKRVVKEVTQRSTSAVVKKGVKRGVKEGSKQIAKQCKKQSLRQATKRVVKESSIITMKETTESVITEGTKQLASEGSKTVAKETVEETVATGTKSLSKLKDGATVGLVVGVAVEGAFLCYKVNQSYQQYRDEKISGNEFRHEVVSNVGSSGGSVAGGAAGAAIGTAILPIFGTFVGGVIGGVMGSFIGSKVSEVADDAIFGGKCPDV